MRFIRFDHFSFFPFFFMAVPTLYEIPHGQVQRDFCSLKGLKSIQELKNLHCKRMTDGTGHVDSEKNEAIAQLSSNESALHVQKESHLGPFVVLRGKKDKKKSKFAVRLVLRHMLSYLIVFWFPVMFLCFCHNVFFFLFLLLEGNH